ncbi:MAG: MaoC family dehydratase [Deltaproteobacteria bacterium]|nr:MaoC family dehydratase [Deltaproteobacteria bacterium]
MDNCRLANELSVGDKAAIVNEVRPVDLPLFAAATGDVNPIHFDQVYAESTFFKGPIAHGMLCAGFISAVIANRLPGLGTVYVSQEVKFLAPVRIRDTITAQVEVLEVDGKKNRVKLRTTCTNQAGVLVVDGEAVVSPPKRIPPPEVSSGMPGRSVACASKLERAAGAFESAFQ